MLEIGPAPKEAQGSTPNPAQELQARLSSLRHEFDALRNERDRLSAELAGRHHEGPSVRNLQKELDETLADHARLQGRLSAEQNTRELLRQAEKERTAAQAEARRMREQAGQMLEQIERLQPQWEAFWGQLSGHGCGLSPRGPK